MNEDQRDAIRECQPNLEKSMPPDYMKSQLIAGHIISLEDDDEIDAIPTRNKKNAALIKMVLRSSSKDSYDIFVRALKSIPTKSNVLADMVESCYKKKSSAISANIDDSDSCAKNGDQSGIKKKRSDISSDTDSVDVKSDQLGTDKRNRLICCRV